MVSNQESIKLLSNIDRVINRLQNKQNYEDTITLILSSSEQFDVYTGLNLLKMEIQKRISND